MDKVKVFVGVDVSKDRLDYACYVPGRGVIHSNHCKNTVAGVSNALREIRKKCGAATGELLFCLEHTGVYCAPFLAASVKLGLAAWQEAGWKIRKAMSTRGKTDALDAARIAEYAFRYKDKARLWEAEPEVVGRLRGLLALRTRLIDSANRLKVPMAEAKAMGGVDKEMAGINKRAIRALKAEVKAVEAEIDKAVAADKDYARNLELAESVPGLGRMTALSLILFTRNFSLFDDPRKLACYCGVAPFEFSSGTSVRGRTRVSHCANKDLKKVLHMAAMAAIQHNPDIRAYFARKVADGKNKMSVINAARNKLIHCVMAVIRKQEKWAPKSSKAKEDFAAVS